QHVHPQGLPADPQVFGNHPARDARSAARGHRGAPRPRARRGPRREPGRRMTTSPKRVVVTGLGIISSLGHDVPTFWQGLCAGKSGVSFIDDFPTDKLRSDVNAKVRDFDPSRLFTRKETEIYGRGVQMSLCAAAE